MENVSKCVQCGNEVVQTPGKKPKIYCTANCRIKHWQKRKRKAPKEPPNPIAYVSIEDHSKVLGELEVLKAANAGLSKDNEALREQLASLQSKYDELVEFNKIPASVTITGNLSDLPNGVSFGKQLGVVGARADFELKSSVKVISIEEAQKKIKEIEKETIPKERDTVNGRKSWDLDQKKKIAELRNYITINQQQ